MSFFGGTACVFCIHFSLTRLQTKTIEEEGTGGSLSVLLLHGYGRKCLLHLSSWAFVSEEEPTVQPKARQEDLRLVIPCKSSWALVEESGLLCSMHLIVLPLH